MTNKELSKLRFNPYIQSLKFLVRCRCFFKPLTDIFIIPHCASRRDVKALFSFGLAGVRSHCSTNCLLFPALGSLSSDAQTRIRRVQEDTIAQEMEAVAQEAAEQAKDADRKALLAVKQCLRDEAKALKAREDELQKKVQATKVL